MEESPPPIRITCRCDACGRSYCLRADLAGKNARCKDCGATFVIRPVLEQAPAAAAPEAVPVTAPLPGQPVCAICQQPVLAGQDATACPECRAPYHQECWQYNHGCGVYGCPQSPPTENRTALEVPASFWGRQDKQCPACGQTILAAAVRCRNCGATFHSAEPQQAETFYQHQTLQEALPAARRGGVWLLIFALPFFTAPLAAVFGAIWYARNRHAIRALPALYGALCKIALGLAVGQSLFLIVVLVAHAMSSGSP